MNKTVIAILLMIFLNVILMGVTLLKRRVMLGVEEINLLSLKFWVSLFFIPQVYLIICLMIFSFMASAAVYSFVSAPEGMVIGWVLIIPTFFLTLLSSHLILGEGMEASQIKGLLFLMVGTIISIYGGYSFLFK